jgi:hypothetical protein
MYSETTVVSFPPRRPAVEVKGWRATCSLLAGKFGSGYAYAEGVRQAEVAT